MKVERQDLTAQIEGIKKGGYDYLVKITAVDYEKYLEVVYILRNTEGSQDTTIEVELDPGDAWVPSIMGFYKGADWYERELYEMFGIEIKGRHVERLLLEKWNGKIAPLRKNFVWNTPYETSD